MKLYFRNRNQNLMPNNPNGEGKLRHIAVSGNIGAGKTTLSTMLSEHYGWNVHYEDTSQNPYLSDFYNDMTRWSFNLQIYFLNSRYQQILHIQKGDKTVIQDRKNMRNGLNHMIWVSY